MTDMTCGNCGICYGMPDEYYKERTNDGKTYYCPNGHARHFIVGECKDQQIARLKDEVSRLAGAIQRAEHNEYQRGYAAGHKKKHKQLALPAPEKMA